MGRYNNHKNSFSTGKIGKRLGGRTDLKDYFNGLEELVNAIPLRQGGITKRPGTQFLQSLDVTDQAQLIPFVESKDSFSLIVIDPGQANIFNHIRVFEPTNFLLSSIFTSYSIEYQGGAGLVSGLTGKYHYAQSASVMFLTHSSGNQRPFVIVKTTATQYELYYMDDGSPAIPFPQTFVRNKAMSVPYMKSNITPNTISTTTTVPSGSIQILTSSTAFFTADHVGARFRLKYGADEAIFRVTIFTNSTTVSAQIEVPTAIATNGPTTDWTESAWSEERKYPGTVTLFEQRSVWGGTPFEPDTVYASLTGNPFHLMETRLAQDIGSVTDISGLNYFGDTTVLDPWSYILSSNQVNKITWMNSSDALQIGTLGGEYIASGGNQILSNESVSIRKQTSYGGEDIQPVQIDNNTFFVTRDGKRLRDFKFNRDNGSFISINANINNEEIVNANISETDNFYNVKFEELTYQQSRDVVWCMTSRNELVGLSFDADAGLLAWHEHLISGSDVKIKSIATLPSTDFNNDDMYMLVERTINSTTVTHIERIAQDFDHITMTPPASGPLPATDVYDNPWYLDSAVIREAAPGTGISGTTISNLSHLEGETVRVLGDGVDLGEFTVTGGSITTLAAVSRAIVGLPYVVRIIPVPVEAGNGRESSQGLTTKIDRTTLRVYKTRDVDMFNLRSTQKQKVTFNNLVAGELFTGDVQGLTPNGIEDRGQFIIQQESAYPLTILSLTYRGVSYDR